MGCVPFDPDYACCEEWSSYTPELQERATDLAWSTLRTLSGSQIGNCPVVVRPCLGPPCPACSQWWWSTGWGVQPVLSHGVWSNCICCDTPSCSCEPLCEIVMPGPVAAIIAVTLDDCEMDLADFRVDNGYRIVRQDGHCWPSCQNLTRPAGERGTLGITYLPGILPDSSALWMAGVLACEFAKACTGAKCRLPTTATTLVRQGVAMTIPQGMFAEGTGIREVDAYLFSINPNGLRLPPMVWSPDVPWGKHRYETPQAKMVP